MVLLTHYFYPLFSAISDGYLVSILSRCLMKDNKNDGTEEGEQIMT